MFIENHIPMNANSMSGKSEYRSHAPRTRPANAPNIAAASGPSKPPPNNHGMAAGVNGRVYLMVLDDLHTNAQRSPLVRAAARQFIVDNALNELIAGKRDDVGIIVQGGLYNALVRSLQQLGLAAKDVAQNVMVSLSGSMQAAPAYWLNPSNNNHHGSCRLKLFSSPI